MNSKAKTAIGWMVAGAGLLVVISAWRLFGPGGADEPSRETLRVLICRPCREMNLVDGTFIELQYREANVRPGGPDGMLFGCPSCGKIEAYFRDIDLVAGHIVCGACGREGPRKANAVAKMIAQHQLETDPNGRLKFWCDDCGAFSAVLSRRKPR